MNDGQRLLIRNRQGFVRTGLLVPGALLLAAAAGLTVFLGVRATTAGPAASAADTWRRTTASMPPVLAAALPGTQEEELATAVWTEMRP